MLVLEMWLDERFEVVSTAPVWRSLRQRDWYFIAEQPAPAPHLAYPDGFAALRIVLVTVAGRDNHVQRPCPHNLNPNWRRGSLIKE